MVPAAPDQDVILGRLLHPLLIPPARARARVAELRAGITAMTRVALAALLVWFVLRPGPRPE